MYSCSLTSSSLTNGWWQVDLQDKYDITRVEIVVTTQGYIFIVVGDNSDLNFKLKMKLIEIKKIKNKTI